MNVEGVKVVTIGGGTGSFTLLSSLKNYVQHLTAIVNMVDDGGSTGVLRDELGALPPGDVRQCLVALSDSTSVSRELFNYRFGEGSLEGHSFGNLFLTALEKVTGNFAEAVETAGSVLAIKGRVVPVTLENITLKYEEGESHEISGEYRIAEADLQQNGNRPQLSLEPNAAIHEDAKKAIEAADIVVIAPGNLYGSLAPALLVEGMADALGNTKGFVVYVANLVTKPGHTHGLNVADHADEIERFIGREVLDYVLYNSKKPSDELLDKYAKSEEYAVDFDVEALKNKHYEAVGDDFVSSEIYQQDSNDTMIERTLIRHNGDAVARHLMRLYFQKPHN